MTTAITPTQAIRSAIRALQHERIKVIRNQRTTQEVTVASSLLGESIQVTRDDAEIIAQIDEEIAALESAIQTLQKYEALRGILKSIVGE